MSYICTCYKEVQIMFMRFLNLNRTKTTYEHALLLIMALNKQVMYSKTTLREHVLYLYMVQGNTNYVNAIFKFEQD